MAVTEVVRGAHDVRDPDADAARDDRAAGGTGDASSFGSLETVCGLALVLLAGLVGAAELHDNSFLTHLATGRWLADGHWSKLWMGTADPYLWTSGGRTWVVQSWLASAAYATAERIGGAAAIRLLVSCTCMGLAWAMWRLSRPGRTLVPRVVAVGGALSIGGTVWSERPMTFGLFFLALSLLAAEGAIGSRWLWLVGWAWVNTHGSFPLGIVALVLLAIGAHLDRADGAHERRALRDLAIGCVAGGVLSPVGPALLWFPVTMLRRQDVLAHVQEWKSTDFAEPWARVFLLLVAIAVIGLVRRPSYRSALPLVVFTAAGAMAGRNVVVASVVLVPVVARGLEGLGEIRTARSGATSLASVVLAVMIPLLVLPRAAEGDFRLDAYPVSAVDWLDQQGLLDGRVRIAEQDFAGNYLELRYGGSVKAFIDDRYDMHDRGLVEDYVHLAHGARGWDEVLERRGIEVVLWQRDSPLGDLLERDQRWVLAFDSAAAENLQQPSAGYVVYCRTGLAACVARP